MQTEAERSAAWAKCLAYKYLVYNGHQRFNNYEFLHNGAEQYTDCDYFVGKKTVGSNQSFCGSLNCELDNGVTQYTY